MKISRNDFDKLIGEMPDFDLHEDYSGRGMFGKSCFGVTTNSPFVLAVAMARVLDPDTMEALAQRASWETMGRNIIIYFPGVTIGDEESIED